MAKSTKVFTKATLYWPKIVGDNALVSNYDGDGREWTFELEPEDTGFLKTHRLLDRLKDPLAYALRLEDRGEKEKAEVARQNAEGRGDYLLIRKPEFNFKGEKNAPFRIYTADNEPWPEDQLIGNGSKADVKLDIRSWGPGKKDSIYAVAIRITDLVPYQSDEFAGMDELESGTKSKPKKKSEDLDDIPFDTD